MPTGLSLDAAMEMAGQLRRAVLEFPEVSYVVTQTGRSDEGLDAWTPSHIEVPIGLTPYDTWPAGETKKDFVKKLNERLQQLPGFSIGISQPIADMVDDLEGGAHSPLVIRIIGDDFNELRRIGGDIVDELRTIRGTASASVFQEPPIPQIVIQVDRAAAARYGINVSDITGLIQTGVGGAAVTQVYVGDRIYNVTVRFPNATRNSPEALGSLDTDQLRAPRFPYRGRHIRLQTGESTITHEMGKRELLVRVDNRDRALSDYLKPRLKQDRPDPSISIPPSTASEWGASSKASSAPRRG